MGWLHCRVESMAFPLACASRTQVSLLWTQEWLTSGFLPMFATCLVGRFAPTAWKPFQTSEYRSLISSLILSYNNFQLSSILTCNIFLLQCQHGMDMTSIESNLLSFYQKPAGTDVPAMLWQCSRQVFLKVWFRDHAHQNFISLINMQGSSPPPNPTILESLGVNTDAAF